MFMTPNASVEAPSDSEVALESVVGQQETPMILQRPNAKRRPEYAAKHCTLCRRYLPISNYYRRGDRHHCYCKVCHYDRTRELRAIKAEHALLTPNASAHRPIWAQENSDE